MANQTQRGKAFEYACLYALKQSLEINQEVIIEKSAALDVALNFYSQLNDKLSANLKSAAQAAVRIILRLEPQLLNPCKNVPLFLSIQEDSLGQAGDVRDVVCIRKQNSWEIGLSCKHNHTAVKHSRLSYTIDFGAVWLGKPCSPKYFEEIKPLFDWLRNLKMQNAKWRDIQEKENNVYSPLLNAFVAELKRLDVQYTGEVPSFLLSYLLGENDFYKVITNDVKKFTQIQAYNIFGTLNRQADGIKSEISVHQLKLPTKIFDISFKGNSKNTIIVTCDNGWALSFRIHNASSLVEPSLKFDIQLVGVPPFLHSQVEPW